MRRKISVVGIIIIVLVGVCLYAYDGMAKYFDSNKRTFNVLVVKSYSKESEKDKMFNKLTPYTRSNVDSLYNYKINTEYLDVSLMDNEEYKKDCMFSMKYKYSNKNIDFIFTVGEEAFDIARNVLDDTDTSLYKTPLFFIDMNKNKTLTEEEKEYITGGYTRSKTKQLLDMIKVVEEDVENINIIISESQSNYYMKKFLKDNSKAYQDININIINFNNINNIYNEIENLDTKENSVNVVSGEFVYDDNSVVLPDDVIEGIKKYSSAPIYTNDIIYLDSGITGSCVLDFNDDINFIREELISRIQKSAEKCTEPQLSETYKRFIDIKSINKYIKHNGVFKSDIDLELYSSKLLDATLLIKTNKNFRNIMILVLLSIVLIFILFIVDRKDKLKEGKNELIRKEKEKIKIDLIATLDHEIRTPLNIILNSTKLIKGNIDDKSYIYTRLDNIDHNSYRLIRVTNNILDITKIEAGSFALNKELVNIVEVVEEVFQECIRFANKKSIEIIFDTEEEEIFTVLDKERFQKAILNIISNAIKFSDSGSEIRGYIHIDNKNVVIDINDNGIGIQQDKLSHIIEKFSQIADTLTRETEGTGIGLYLATQIIEKHNGKILITSEANKGTLVKIVLPIINEDAQSEWPSSMLTVKELAEIEMSDLM